MMTAIIALLVLGALAWWTWKAPRLSCSTVWALVGAILISAAIVCITPGDLRARMLWTSYALPCIWVVLVLWSYWEAKIWRLLSGMLGFTAISAVLVFFFKPVI